MQRRDVSHGSLTARIDSLRARHREISARIHSEQMRPLPDTHRLGRLKRERLWLKDAIRGVSAKMDHSGAQPTSAA